MTVVFDYRVMFNQCTRIDDAVLANLRAGVDDGAVHDDGARSNACMSGHIRGRRDNVGQGKPKLDGLLIEADALVRRAKLANGNEGVLIVFGQLWQFRVSGDDVITEVLGVQFLLQSDQPRDLVLTMLFDDIDTGMGVSSCTNQDCAGIAHLVGFHVLSTAGSCF